MSQGNVFHWSKDFVEHLRTVHFSLTIVAVALIITGTNTESQKTAKAFTQVHQISQLSRQWPSVQRQISKRAMLDSNLETNWSPPIAIVVPQEIYSPQEIDSFFTVPENIVIATDSWRFGGKGLPTDLASLSQFRDVWNELHKGITLSMPEKPNLPSGCREYVRLEHPDGSTDLLIDSGGNDGTPFLDVKINDFLLGMHLRGGVLQNAKSDVG